MVLPSTSMMPPGRKLSAPRPKCEGLFYVVNGIFLGSFLIFMLQSRSVRTDSTPLSASSVVEQCATSMIRGVDSQASPLLPEAGIVSPEAPAVAPRSDDDYSFVVDSDSVDSCLDPEGPLPVILMSLGRSGTDSTWQILKELTGSQMKAIEIVGAYEEETVDFFRGIQGLPSPANTWAVREDYNWRKQGGGAASVRGFYDHIRDFCKDGNCDDGKWMFKWFCDEQRRYKETGGLVGFKWKAYMSALNIEPARRALELAGKLGQSKTPVRVIRSRRNPFDVYLSELKHKSVENLPDHCRAGDDECFKKHASVKLKVPVEEMFEWLDKTFAEENAVDAVLSELGIRTIHVAYDDLYYSRTEEEGRVAWNKIFTFLGQKDDWEWSDIAGAAGLKPTTKSRSHRVLLENFDEVYAKLKGTKLEQFLRDGDE